MGIWGKVVLANWNPSPSQNFIVMTLHGCDGFLRICLCIDPPMIFDFTFFHLALGCRLAEDGAEDRSFLD